MPGLQDLRKIEAGQISLESLVFSPKVLLRESLDSFAATAVQSGVEMILDVDVQYSGDVVGDCKRFRQIVDNGLSNACKFSRKPGKSNYDQVSSLLCSKVIPGGAVHVRLRQETESETMVGILVELQDTGEGITKEVLATLFQPFK